jgi:hypothetical protein
VLAWGRAVLVKAVLELAMVELATALVYYL